MRNIKSAKWAFRTVVTACIAALPLAGCKSLPASRTSVMTSAAQKSMSPTDVLADLKAGNQRFVLGNETSQDWLEQAKRTAQDGQYPKAIVLSCLDSRVIPETVFDQGIGDIFVGRVAGNFENGDQLGSMEFGTAVAGAKLIVVLGHTSCGAVKGAIDRAELGNLTAMLQNIEPAINAVPVGSAGRTSSDKAYVNQVVEANVRQTVRDISARSEVLAGRIASGELMVVGAVYDLPTGRVLWME